MTRGQFHQRFTCSFFSQSFFALLGSYFLFASDTSFAFSGCEIKRLIILAFAVICKAKLRQSFLTCVYCMQLRFQSKYLCLPINVISLKTQPLAGNACEKCSSQRSLRDFTLWHRYLCIFMTYQMPTVLFFQPRWYSATLSLHSTFVVVNCWLDVFFGQHVNNLFGSFIIERQQ